MVAHNSNNESDTAVLEQEESQEVREKEPGQREAAEAAEEAVIGFQKDLNRMIRDAEAHANNPEVAAVQREAQFEAVKATAQVQGVASEDAVVAVALERRLEQHEAKLEHGHEDERKARVLPEKVLQWERAIASLQRDRKQIAQEFSVHRQDEKHWSTGEEKKDKALRAEQRRIDAELERIHKEQEVYKEHELSKGIARLRDEILAIEEGRAFLTYNRRTEKGKKETKDDQIHEKEEELRRYEQALYYMENGKLPPEKGVLARDKRRDAMESGSANLEWADRFQREAEQVASPDDLRRMISEKDIEAAIADFDSKYTLHDDGRIRKSKAHPHAASETLPSWTPQEFVNLYWNDIKGQSSDMPEGFLRVKHTDGTWRLGALRAVAIPLWAERQEKGLAKAESAETKPEASGEHEWKYSVDDVKRAIAEAKRKPSHEARAQLNEMYDYFTKILEPVTFSTDAEGRRIYASIEQTILRPLGRAIHEISGGRLKKMDAGEDREGNDAWNRGEQILNKFEELVQRYKENEQFKGEAPDRAPGFIQARNAFQEKFGERLYYNLGTGKLETSKDTMPGFWAWFGRGKKEYQEGRAAVEQAVHQWGAYEQQRDALKQSARDLFGRWERFQTMWSAKYPKDSQLEGLQLRLEDAAQEMHMRVQKKEAPAIKRSQPAETREQLAKAA